MGGCVSAQIGCVGNESKKKNSRKKNKPPSRRRRGGAIRRRVCSGLSDSSSLDAHNNNNNKRSARPSTDRSFTNPTFQGWRTMLVVPELEREVELLCGLRDTRKFYDKFNIRHNIAELLEYLWQVPAHRNAWRQIAKAEEKGVYLNFLNFLINDSIFLLDESLNKICFSIAEFILLRTRFNSYI